MAGIFKSVVAFSLAYLALMMPTYVLPWFGSNSVLINVVGVAVGKGMTPQWWIHAWSLAMLVIVAWVRGDAIGKGYLAVVALIAATFDLMPVLSAIPFVPTICHLVVIFAGVRGSVQDRPYAEGDNAGPSRVPRWAGVSATIVTGVAALGAATFIATAGKQASATVVKETTVSEKSVQGPSARQSSDIVVNQQAAEASTPAKTANNEIQKPSETNSAPPPTNSARKTANSQPQSAPKKTGEPPRVRYINIHE